MRIRDVALLVLDRLERLEAEQLAWGLVDGGFSRDELLRVVNAVIEEQETQHGQLWVAPNEVLDVLEKDVLLWQTPDHSGKYRTRSAESVRLFARLRQILKADQWRSARTLVSDFRYQVVPRRFPRRDLPPESVFERLSGGPGVSPEQESLLSRVLQAEEPEPVQLSEFQVQAAEAILAGVRADRIGATVIAAGTGAGKTLAFLLPALMHLIGEGNSTRHSKAIAVYPRNELLKDQLRAVLELLLTIREDTIKLRGSPISVGALFGAVPRDLNGVIHPRWGWSAHGAGEDAGHICPFMQCPECDNDLVWRKADMESHSQALNCVNHRCRFRVPDGLLRLTRHALRTNPPDILFTSTEMLNRSSTDPRMRSLFGIGTRGAPRVLLLDEIHTYSGIHGAQVAVLLRRWRRLAQARPHVIGLSATLADASRFMSELTGVFENNVRVVEPSLEDMEARGAEYTLALRGDPVSETSLLSTTIQSAMLMGRVLDPVEAPTSDGVYGTKVFAFADNLDVINRLHDSLTSAEGVRRPAIGSLANLRSPAIQPSIPRWKAGQSWDLCADIGHSLTPGTQRRVARVSSQDSGVDKGAPTIVATASLEVGFDDPDVGAVIQHKAPRDPAAYIQRRGRAGRGLAMRPWTVVVLSDYGRDRLAYQRYEDLFSPVVSARFLPIHNPFVLKIQAVFALLDWIGEKVPVPGVYSVFRLLSRPLQGAETWYDQVASLLLRVLQDPQTEAELRHYLGSVLEIDKAQTVEVMWTAPRSLMLEVIPTVIRRLETRWQDEEPQQRYPLPLPEFLPSALFADLNLPELSISLPDSDGEHRMPFRQGLMEFAPGRVSRRFGTSHQELAHWISVPYDDESEFVDLGKTLDRKRLWELGKFEYRSSSDTQEIRVVRPAAILVEQAPKKVSSTSNAFLVWQTEAKVKYDGRQIRLPPAAAARFRLSSITSFLHGRGASVEMRRFATAVDAETRRSQGRGSTPPCRYSFVLDDRPVAMGYSQRVDALRIRLDLPPRLSEAFPDNVELVRHLRVLRFHSLLHKDDGIRALANKFQVDWICDAVLSTLGREVLNSGRTVPDVATDTRAMCPEKWITALRTIFDVTEAPADASDGAEAGEAAGDLAGNRRFRELVDLLQDPTVDRAIHRTLPELYQPIDADWEPWLAVVVHQTMASAILAAVQSLISDMAFDDLLVDVLPEVVGDPVSDPRTMLDIWITEDTPGGAGLLERVESLIQADPQRFLALLESELQASDAEQARIDLGRVSGWLAPSSPEYRSDVAEAATALRSSETHQEESEGLEDLKRALGKSGMFLNPVTLAAVNLRLLRPGSSSKTDDLYHRLFSDWDKAEEQLGYEINPRVFAEIKSHDGAIDALLPTVTEGGSPATRESWRFDVLNGLLWPSRGTLRLETLRYYNPFSDPPICDRLVLSSLVSGDIPVVDVSGPEWRARLADEVRRLGTVDLFAPEDESRAIREALVDLSINPLDIGALRVHPRVRGFLHRKGGGAVRLEVPELFGVPVDG